MVLIVIIYYINKRVTALEPVSKNYMLYKERLKMINLKKVNKCSSVTNATKVFEGTIYPNNEKGNINMTSETNQHEQQMSIEEVMSKVGFEKKLIKKAIAIQFELKHFLKTNEDCNNFIKIVQDRELYPWVRMFPVKLMELAKEIGAYHYTYHNLAHLEQMGIKDALEALFLEPFTQAKMEVYHNTKLSMKQLFELRMQNPKSLFLNLTLCIV